MRCDYLKNASYLIGFLFILAAFGRAMLQTPGANLNGGAVSNPFDPKAWAELIKAIVEFVKVAPAWALLFAAGLILLLAVPRFIC